MDELDLIADYRLRLKRAAWRAQYKTRTRFRREVPILRAVQAPDKHSERWLSQLFVDQVIMQLPPSRGRTIFRKLVVEGKSEQEISREMGISQQAVSKWKRKAAGIIRSQLDRSVLW